MENHRVVILGNGPAGVSAALYAARSGLSPVIIAGPLSGGQLVYTEQIENFPGVPTQAGFSLVETFQKQLTDMQVRTIFEKVTSVDLSVRPFYLVLSSGEALSCDSLIIATGSSPVWLDIKGEEKFKGKGISICATCDGYFYRGKEVAVIGGGNTALYEALFLSGLARKVYLINRGHNFSGEKTLADKARRATNIEIIENAETLSFEGADKLESLTFLQAGKALTLPIDGVFVAVGQRPNSELFLSQLKHDDTGYLWTDRATQETSLRGVFAAGDVQERYYRQAIIACGTGAVAALSAERYLMENKTD